MHIKEFIENAIFVIYINYIYFTKELHGNVYLKTKIVFPKFCTNLLLEYIATNSP